MAPAPETLLTLVHGAETSVDVYRSSFSARSALAAELAEATDWLGANRPQVALAVLIEPTMADDYLPYAAYATAEQSVTAYPGLPHFFAKKREYDPDGLFTNYFLHDYGPRVGGRA